VRKRWIRITLAKGWDRDHKAGQAILEVGAEFALVAHGLKVAICRGNEAHVAAQVPRAAQPTKAATLQSIAFTPECGNGGGEYSRPAKADMGVSGVLCLIERRQADVLELLL
jgi:hypothetical protein